MTSSNDGIRLTGCNNVLVLEKDTLGGASTTRGVHDAAQVVRLWHNGVDWVVPAGLDEIIKARDCEMVVGVLELINVGLLDVGLTVVDDMLNVLGFLQRVDEFGEKMRVKEDGLGVCLLERVLETLLSERVVGGNDWHRLGSSAYEASALKELNWASIQLTMGNGEPPRARAWVSTVAFQAVFGV